MDEKTTIAKSEELTFSPGAFDSFMSKVTGSMSEGETHSSLRRRTVTITIDPELCRLDTFDKPFRLELQELSSAAELRVFKAMSVGGKKPASQDGEEDDEDGGSGGALSSLMGKASIRAVNGRVLLPHEVDTLWEALGMGGRTVAGMAFMSHCAGIDEELVGKAMSSVEIG